MRVLGLTGSIGMGKSTASAMLRRLRVPVHDADAVVHGLLRAGGKAVAPIAQTFPGVVEQGAVNRQALGQKVFGQPEALRTLENILHPLVRREEQGFLRRHRRRKSPVVALDIPLLFETGGEARCDLVLVVSCPAFVQTQRVLRRQGMTLEKLNAIRTLQMSDREKRRRADVVLPTGRGKLAVWRRLVRIVRSGASWPLT